MLCVMELKSTIYWGWPAVRVFELVSLSPASHISIILTHKYTSSILNVFCLSVGLQLTG